MIPPLTPAGCDLRTMPYMPFQVVRFLQSDLVALATPAEGWAALQIWLRSWLQVPAASLPNDERILAKGAGLSLVEWRAVADMALRGWIEASDGRLYHPVVAEKALEAWIERLRLRRRSAIGNAKRYRREADLTTFDAELSDAVSMLSRLSPDSASRVAKLLEGEGTAPIGSQKPSPREVETLLTKGEGEQSRDIGANAPDRTKPTKVSPLAQPLKPDADFLAVWNGATDQMRRRAKSKANAWKEWAKVRKAHDGARIVAGLRAYLKGDPDVSRTGGPGLHIWLRDQTFDTWAGDTETADGWSPERWGIALSLWQQSGQWGDDMGPKPGEPGCMAPANLLLREAG